jgi:2-dehydropantoate 2-reductase
MLDSALEHVLGGQCVIAATLDAQGIVRHLNQSHSLTFGERDGTSSERMHRITQCLTDAGFEARPSDTILQDMWDKWVFLASLAGITCLMRAPVGDIVAAPGGAAVTLRLLEECRAVAERSGHAPGEATWQRARGVLTEPGSSLTASMLRDSAAWPCDRSGPRDRRHAGSRRRVAGWPLAAGGGLRAFESL